MLAPALRQDLLERLDALARPAGEVAQGPLLELVVDLFLAQSEVEEPERRRACLDLALSLVPRAAPEPLRAIASRPGLTEDVADAIVRRGDRDAVALLVANRSARLAPGQPRGGRGPRLARRRASRRLRAALRLARSDRRQALALAP